MDLLIVALGVFVFGSIKVYSSGGFKLEESPVMNKDGSITTAGASVSVGNNLTLKREPEAFTLILKELGLM